MKPTLKSKKAKISLGALSTLCVFSIMSSEAKAEVLLGTTRTSPVIYGGATYNVDFNGSAPGGQTFTFSTTKPNTRVVITFNAECAVDGNSFEWLDLDLLVNPAGPVGETAVPPSNDDNAFCSGNETPSDFLYGGGDGWVSAVTQATMVLAQPGNHNVTVQVNGGSAGVARLDDMSLVIQR